MDYADHHPTPAETVLLIEVANTSLARDRGSKRRIYAWAGTPEYWIVDLRNRHIEAYHDPTGPDDAPDYRRRSEYGPDAQIPLFIPDVPPLEVATLFSSQA